MIIFYLTTIPTCYTLHLQPLNETNSVLAVWLHTNISSLHALSLQTRKPLNSCILAPKNITSPPFVFFSLFLFALGGMCVWEVMWWGNKALCQLRRTVISGGRGELWRSRPWILVTGCWWSLPASRGTPHSGIYSQRCRNRSWEDPRPSADTQRRGQV